MVVPLIGSQLATGLWVNALLYSTFGQGDLVSLPSEGLMILFSISVFICDDFARFYVHYLYHKVPFLWRFHAIHHSATTLTPLTLYRVHTLEMLINSLRSVIIVGGLIGIFLYLFVGKMSLLNIMGVNAFTFLFNAFSANLRHSPVWLSFGKFEKWLISPALHHIHHSYSPHHYDKNFGSCLAVWDRLFGSWLSSKGQKVEHFGLKKHLKTTLFFNNC